MPYITPEARERLDITWLPRDEGELNYLITKLLIRYAAKSPVNYARLAGAHSAATLAAAEFYRRRIAPYEDHKIRLNGDVY